MLLKEGKINKTAILYFIVVAILTRLAGDVIILLINRVYSQGQTVWKSFTSVVIIVSIGYLVLSDLKVNRNKPQEFINEEYYRDLKLLLIFTSIIAVTLIFLPSQVFASSDNAISLTFFNLFTVFSVFTSFYLLSFFIKWTIIYRHKNTSSLLKFIMAFAALLAISFPLADFRIENIDTSHFEVKTYPFFDTIKILISIFMVILVFIITKKNHWLALLSVPKKLSLLLMVTLVLGALFFIDLSYKYDSSIFEVYYLFSPVAAAIFDIPVFILSIYFLRIFLALLGSFPATRVLEHQSDEISSLTYLNKLVAVNKDMDNLLSNVADLAIRASGASAGWIEKYHEQGGYEICSIHYLDKTLVEEIHKDQRLHNFLKNIEKPTIIESIPVDSNFYFGSELKLMFAESLIAVPLYTNGSRFGTLIVLHPDEFGFEYESLKILESFNDNIGIALENSRLMNESIEKERLTREFTLAREMQQKLLPIKLPELENYSLSALSLSADEVGGDFYHTCELKDGRTCLLIGDVSGKGISAAFYMAQVKGLLLGLARQAVSAKELLISLNSILFDHMEKSIFITISAFVINDNMGNVTFARAGHMPLICTSNGKAREYSPLGIGVGLTGSTLFEKTIEEVDVKLDDGDIFLLYTDGLNELRNPVNEDYGLNSLKQILENQVYIDAEQIVEKIREDVSNFADGVKIFDDMTLVAGKFFNEEPRTKLRGINHI